MTREQLEHIIRAAAVIADDDEIVVIGSQAILGQFPNAPAELLTSMEADVYPKNRPQHSDVIDGAIGELSPFHDTFGYYAQGVDERTATLPSGWKERLVPIRGPGTRNATGLCLEVHDLVISKLVAGRPKDVAFASAAAKHRMIDASVLRARLSMTELTPELRAAVETRVHIAIS